MRTRRPLFAMTVKGSKESSARFPRRDIAALVNGDAGGALFDSNIRRFLGKGRAVNAEILRTATDANSSYLFWFLNNGLTIVCDNCDPVTDPDKPMVKITNLQIVNGCQTASALAHAARDGTLRSDTRVLLKIFQTTDQTLGSRIVVTTNNQNRISSRDLKANDTRAQQDMKRRFERYGLLYEHIVNQYANNHAGSFGTKDSVERGRRAGVPRGRDHKEARRRSPPKVDKVWTDNYAEIFSGRAVEPHVICVLLRQSATVWAKTAGRTGRHHRT